MGRGEGMTMNNSKSIKINLIAIRIRVMLTLGLRMTHVSQSVGLSVGSLRFMYLQYLKQPDVHEIYCEH